MDQLDNIIEEFANLVTSSPGPIEGSWKFVGGDSLPSLLFTFAIHGDEIGTLPSALKVMNLLRDGSLSYDGTILFALGNTTAIPKGVRFINYDLNRRFKSTSEGRDDETLRAQSLMKLLLECEYHFDFHQTIQPTDRPFYIGGPIKESIDLAKRIGVCEYYIEVPTEKSDRDGTMTSWARINGKKHLSIEVSKKGFSTDADRVTLNLLNRILLAMQDSQFSAKEAIQVVFIEHSIPFDGPLMTLREGLKNFSPLKAGQIIGTRSDKSDFLCPVDGWCLFPKYPERNAKGEVIGEIPTSIIDILVEKR